MQITIVFEEGTDIYFARQLVAERIGQAIAIVPKEIAPTLGPIASGLGEIVMWQLTTNTNSVAQDQSETSMTELREFQDWVIRPQLMQIPGIAEINAIGGFERTIVIAPDLDALSARGLTLQDLLTTLELNNSNKGAGYIEKNGEQILVRIPGQVSEAQQLNSLVVKSIDGVPIFVGDIAAIVDGGDLRTGAATANGVETVIGTAMMRIGENSQSVAQRVVARLQSIQKSLPSSIRIRILYDRTQLVDATIATVQRNLVEGAILVTVVLFLMLGNFRAAILTAAVIPLSMLLTVSGMLVSKLSANLMSLGAIDFGIIVDGAVVIVENIVRKMAVAKSNGIFPTSKQVRRQIVYDSVLEVRRAILTGQLIIMVVYLPVLSLSGVEGKMFRPLATTVLLALAGAAVLSVSFIPAMAGIFLSDSRIHVKGPISTILDRSYITLLASARRHGQLVSIGVAAVVLFSFLFASRLGTEFVPNLDEGDMALHAMRIPGTSLTQSIAMQKQVENTLLELPEVATVFSKIGTADIATDPMPPNVADTFVMLRPRSEWPVPSLSKNDLIAKMDKVVDGLLGNTFEFTQPIQMRFNELIAGTRADIAVKIFGDDSKILKKTSLKIGEVLAGVTGSRDVRISQTAGLPMLGVDIDRDKIARFGIPLHTVQDIVQTTIAGRRTGTLYKGDRQFDIVVRLADSLHSNLESIAALRIPIADSQSNTRQFVRLDQIANLHISSGPNQISRLNGKRYTTASTNVRGRDIGGFVSDAKAKIQQTISIPPGYWISWGGQFEQLVSATKRLKIVVPIALTLILAILYTGFGNIKDALLVFSGVPLALSGGLASLSFRGMPFSISAGIGFVALCGVAVLNGLVMVSVIQDGRSQGLSLLEAINTGARQRLRPVLMTALVASLGFVPMALAVGRGAEVQRPVATVVIGGIISSTILTLLILPLLYEWVHRKSAAV